MPREAVAVGSSMAQCVNPNFMYSDGPIRTGHKVQLRTMAIGMVDPQLIPVRCGKCVACRAHRASKKAAQLFHESTCWDQSCFITLTYNDENLPGFTLGDIAPDWEPFYRRLERYLKGQGICDFAWYAAAELGYQDGRPHFHLILYGTDFIDGSSKQGTGFKNPELESLWKKGFIHIQPLTAASCNYICKHFRKSHYEKAFTPRGTKFLGRKFVEKYGECDIARTGKVIINGGFYPLPDSYRKWFPEAFEAYDEKRRAYALKHCDPELQLKSAEARRLNLLAAQAHNYANPTPKTRRPSVV